MKLSIVTQRDPQKTFDVSKVFLPGIDGSLEILSGHAPLITALGCGDVRWDEDGVQHIESGFVEVRDNIIKVVAE